MHELKYNDLIDNIFLIKKGIKKKGKEYGIVKISKSQINGLMESINLLSSSGMISAKFSQKLESYLHPRYSEIYETCFTNKSLPEEVGVEISRENVKEIIVALEMPSIYRVLEMYDLKNLTKILNNIEWQKYKP